MDFRPFFNTIFKRTHFAVMRFKDKICAIAQRADQKLSLFVYIHVYIYWVCFLSVFFDLSSSSSLDPKSFGIAQPANAVARVAIVNPVKTLSTWIAEEYYLSASLYIHFLCKYNQSNMTFKQDQLRRSKEKMLIRALKCISLIQ